MTHPNSLELEALAAGDTNDVAEHVANCKECSAYVDRAKELPAPKAFVLPRPNVLRLVSTVVVPLALAAGILLFLRRPPLPKGDMTAPMPKADYSASFKGGLQVAVVRERGNDQTRFVGAVSVKPGDRLRVEVALDHEQSIMAAVRADDGSWLELMPEGVRGAGTHFSERSARIDDSPMRGTILVGPSDLVNQARSGMRVDGVSVIRVEWDR